MNTILVWLLISVSYSTHNYGTATVIGHFKDLSHCEHVRKNMPLDRAIEAKCIQAEIIKP